MEIEKRRLKLFLIFAFGISWASAVVIAMTGGLVNSPELIPNSGVTLALVLEASVYMWGPALANIITRAITHESWGNALLKPQLKRGWPYWLAGWFGPGLATVIGIVLFFIFLPQYYDSNFTALRAQLEAANPGSAINPMSVIISQTVVAFLLSPVLNAVSTFGEEFGWRGYLLPKLSAQMGNRKALLVSSAIWGVWHWPVIAMGHNYGLSYWGYPWLGMVMMVWFTLSVGVFFGWLTQKAGSFWPAVIAHGALNGIAALGLLFVSGPTPMILGPSPAGLIGCIPFTVASAIILAKMKD
ncbi:MAG: protease family protein [Chloroflexota bacterium]|nr:protease family protein [Chloroflexota bacterium]